MIIFYLLFQIGSSFAIDNAINSCDSAIARAASACGVSTTVSSCKTAADACLSSCSPLVNNTAKPFAYRASLRTTHIPQCTTWAGGGGRSTVTTPPVDDNLQAREACNTYNGRTTSQLAATADEDLVSCKEQCLKAAAAYPSEATRLSATAAKCWAQVETAAPDINTADTNGGSADDSVTTDDGGANDAGTSDDSATDVTSEYRPPAPTPTPNTAQNLLSGLGGGNTSGGSSELPPMPAFQPVNWATGPTADHGLFSSAAQDAMAASRDGGGFQPSRGEYQASDIVGASYTGVDAKQANNGAAGAGGGAPPPPMMGGGAMAGAGGAGGPRGGPGAPRRGGYAGGSSAGAALGKVGQNTFYSGGGGMAPGQKRATAATLKPKAESRYRPKSNDSGAALNRLFGSGMGRVRNGPGTGAFQTRGCLDATVFCSLETFFQRVDHRDPSSESGWQDK